MAAYLGNADAQTYIGCCDENGYVIVKDMTEAVYWFRMAAYQGNADTQTYICCCYVNEHGVVKDMTKAASRLRKAAEQGNSSAQTKLGRMYSLGCGVKLNFERSSVLVPKGR
jgi:TPR repeat protein